MFTRTRKTVCLLLTVSLVMGCLIFLSACQKKTEELNLYVAAGLKKPMDVVVEAFKQQTGAQTAPNYGPSGGLYTQIIEGQPCDIYFSADWLYIEKLESEGKLAASQKFLIDEVALVVSKDGAAKVKSVQDLIAPGVTVGICEPKAPVGFYAEQGLKSLGLWDKLNAGGNLKSRPSTVNQLAIMVKENELDAGLIFCSVANGNDLPIVERLSTKDTGEIIFGAGIIKGGNEKLAQKFLDIANENVSEFNKYGWKAYSK